MRLTQGQFSFLPDLTDAEISKQVQYALEQGWAVAVEYTDDPHPRNYYWHMWGTPMFDLRDAKGVVMEIDACRKAHPDMYVKVLAFDSSEGFESVRMSFIVNRPAEEPGFELVRDEGAGRQVHYTIRSYATSSPAGRRYQAGTGNGR
ncbi:MULTISPECIES: ribulose bisphosphate carboxylase small subunit [Rhodospirillales]|uniref:Ribulose bisphosphate carboxylase small subunit n=2 Tax=Rhodospirillales TaxID=204441 RepID=B6IYM7_RHOCS|nr:ribulose bisphosphate carboxylase small subunit [Rhodospirillum centenum]ACJ01401.1 ribulose bisphosphate carboxylase small chain [Rhodospirillum centenum SW]